ncbi:MAG: hypothetical protein RLZZ450_1092 [Pseudomonadota bacterium]
MPPTLECTGLYGAAGTGPVEKAVHASNREFAPGTALWSDGADKKRWIQLPNGKQINTTDPNAWDFPEGTRVWKEFGFKGKRVETRYMLKNQGVWEFRTYKWNDTDTDAVSIETGADVMLPGGQLYTIPTPEQCNECHVGSRDKLLGFQQVLLGLPGAKGLDLATLAAEKRLSVPPARTNYTIPDDGTGMSAQVLSWIHVNCGVSCHNETGNAKANSSKLFMRIDPGQLDAPTTADWNIIKLTLGVKSVTANFFGNTRIIPGAPDDSLIVQLAQTRGSNRAMPPLGTRIVDPNAIGAIREWITRLGGGKPPLDGGLPVDSGVRADATTGDGSLPVADGAVPDAEVSDAGIADADVADAGVADAGEPDAEVPDAGVPPVVVDPGPVTPPVTPPVVEPPVTPPVTEPPVVAPPVTPPVVEPPVTPPVVVPPVTQAPVATDSAVVPPAVVAS